MDATEQGVRGRDRAWLIACMALGAATALLSTLSAPLPWFNDAMIYLSLGDHLARGEGYTSSLHIFHDLIQPPLYPLAIALGSLVSTPLHAAIAIVVLAWTLTLPALVRIHRRMWGPKAWLVTAFAMVLCPILGISSMLATEPLFVCLTAWAVAFGLEAAEGEALGPALACGLCIGLSVLTRPEGLLTGALLGALWLWRTRAPHPRRKLAQIAGGALVATLLLVPYGLFLRARLGHFTIAPKLDYNRPYAEVLARLDWPPDEEVLPHRDQHPGYALMPDHSEFVFAYALLHPEFDARTQFPLRPDAGPRSKLRDVLAAARLVAWTALRAFGFWNPVVIALILIGLICAWRGAGTDGTGPPIALLVTTAAITAAFLLPALSSSLNFEYRFLAVSAVISLALVGGGAARVQAFVSKRGATRFLPLLLIGFIAVQGLCLRNALARMNGPHIGREHMAELDAQCLAHIPRGGRILEQNARCAFLTHGLFYAVPYAAELEPLTDYIEHHQIDYAIFDDQEMARHPSPVIRALRDRTAWPSGWKLLDTLRSVHGEVTYVVRLR